MTFESHHLDRKSLRIVTGPKPDYAALAQDCVCFANGAGGTLLIGVEDGVDAPPADQRIDAALLDTIHKRVAERTVNVRALPELKRHENGGDYIVLTIPRAAGVASTSDGRYYVRVGDQCRPVVGDDVMRLADERPSTPWESMTALGVARMSADPGEVARFVAGIRASDRVKASVDEKSDGELLPHDGLATGDPGTADLGPRRVPRGDPGADVPPAGRFRPRWQQWPITDGRKRSMCMKSFDLLSGHGPRRPRERGRDEGRSRG
jgi:ATP-dependent DNA helicase RecG